jgi:hypothetical protein
MEEVHDAKSRVVTRARRVGVFVERTGVAKNAGFPVALRERNVSACATCTAEFGAVSWMAARRRIAAMATASPTAVEGVVRRKTAIVRSVRETTVRCTRRLPMTHHSRLVAVKVLHRRNAPFQLLQA